MADMPFVALVVALASFVGEVVLLAIFWRRAIASPKPAITRPEMILDTKVTSAAMALLLASKPKNAIIPMQIASHPVIDNAVPIPLRFSML